MKVFVIALLFLASVTLFADRRSVIARKLQTDVTDQSNNTSNGNGSSGSLNATANVDNSTSSLNGTANTTNNASSASASSSVNLKFNNQSSSLNFSANATKYSDHLASGVALALGAVSVIIAC
eukprot:TRINITY_DN10951_c0_g1_i1.p1 TRINITY_DN10951_c0_g1~~TRINITY_DN10951_c0_g1_i1.p1  ORF type:complete len:123 (+),score=20.81 TRINITY_DN10951_c0_g1_i1:172-540(+)